MSKVCDAPSALGATFQEAAGFGKWAERRIGSDYLQFVGRTQWYPLSVIDYADFTAGWRNVDIFFSFLKTNNPGRITPINETSLRMMAGLTRCPDLATHDPSLDRFEYYEIKPASVSGRAAGLAKLAALDALFARFHLPYKGGNSFTGPVGDAYLGSANVFGTRIEFYFHYWNDGNGLLFYQICAKGNLNELAMKFAVALSIAAFLYALFTFGLKVPA